ncbi:hypothetical protein [Actinoplanes sp. NPDC049118]|uniref:hypothetical protein n=1 Tax=Actinoplanes sp. NPDC049118 TaxID=3155769 RepID=UPI0033E76E93
MTQALGVAPGKAPAAMAFVIATESLPRGRMITGCGSVAHGGQFPGAEQLKLPHVFIIPRSGED